jgi:hypothetical protein
MPSQRDDACFCWIFASHALFSFQTRSYYDRGNRWRSKIWPLLRWRWNRVGRAINTHEGGISMEKRPLYLLYTGWLLTYTLHSNRIINTFILSQDGRRTAR